jgi:DNA polymerase III delta prime subunit
MQPKIIVSKNREEWDEEVWKILQESRITANNPDLFALEDEKIGIAQIKQLISHLSTKPFGKTAKSVVIWNGNNISPDAQNALLKILEEPPGESIILIGVDSETKLLPTVLSRCLVLNHKSGIMNQGKDFDLNQILNVSIEERVDIVEKTTNKEQFLNDLTESYRQKVLKGEGSSEFLEELLQAQIWKENNVNLRTILEYLAIKLPK